MAESQLVAGWLPLLGWLSKGHGVDGCWCNLMHSLLQLATSVRRHGTDLRCVLSQSKAIFLLKSGRSLSLGRGLSRAGMVFRSLISTGRYYC
jgi:hypothetical protein